jgi:dTDP-4-amino-4,6-dideoxygalactose transaminase
MGCICTNSDEVAEVCRRLKAHGRVCACKRCTRGQGICPEMAKSDPRFTSLYPGFNFKPMEFQAALARVFNRLKRTWKGVYAMYGYTIHC